MANVACSRFGTRLVKNIVQSSPLVSVNFSYERVALIAYSTYYISVTFSYECDLFFSFCSLLSVMANVVFVQYMYVQLLKWIIITPLQLFTEGQGNFWCWMMSQTNHPSTVVLLLSKHGIFGLTFLLCFEPVFLILLQSLRTGFVISNSMLLIMLRRYC